MGSKSQFHYEIGLEIDGCEGEAIDVNWCSFIRAPVFKLASYCLLKCFLPQVLIEEMIENISDNNFPVIKLNIYLLNELSKSYDERLNPIFEKSLLCIGCTPLKVLDLSQNSSHVILVLTNPIIYYMGMTNTYNKILTNVTAYDGIKAFESWATETHGSVFDFKHIGMGTSINKTQYEQLLFKTSSDLMIPSYLIYGYKTNDFLSWYFFDDFYIDKKSKKEIVCTCINAEALADQEGDRIEEYPDMNKLTKIVREIPIADISKKYDKDGNAFIFTTNEMKYNHEKIPQSSVPKKSGNMKTINIMDGRDLSVSKNGSISTTTIPQSTTISNIYVPDNPQQALKRFEKCKDIMKDKIRRFVSVEVTNSFMDYPQIGKKYDIEKSGRYNYSPLSIVNTFVRKTDKEEFHSLINRSLMINFRN